MPNPNSATPSPKGPRLATICGIAGIRLRQQPQGEANFAALLPIIRVLLEMRRADLLTAIWIDDLRLRVQYAGSRERSNVSWRTAERLTSVYLQRSSTCDDGDSVKRLLYGEGG